MQIAAAMELMWMLLPIWQIANEMEPMESLG